MSQRKGPCAGGIARKKFSVVKVGGRNVVCGSGERQNKIEVFSKHIVMFFIEDIQFGVLASTEGIHCVLCHYCLGDISMLAEKTLDFFPDMEANSLVVY